MDRLLVVDDEARAAAVMAELLRRAGFGVEVAHGGREALERATAAPPDLMLLDFDMPDLDGLEVLEALREGNESQPPFPVLILTGARLSPGDQVLGLERGASDYIVKGVDRQVLIARIRRALRERRPAPGPIQCGRLKLDPTGGTVQLEGRMLRIEPRPFLVLCELAKHPRRLMTRSELLEAAWRTDYTGFDHAVEQAIYALRRAIGEPGWIETVPRRGYRLNPQ